MSQTHPLVTTSSLQSPTERLNQFKRFLQKEGLDGFLVPKVDEHQGEYVPPHAERLRWLTGFSGSAGFAIVLQEKTALFVDGRYTLQAQDQVDTTVVEICPLANINPHTWLKDHIQAKQRIGFDPWLHTRENLERFQNEVTETETEWIPCSSNPIDELWTDQPARPQTKLKLHDVQFAGKTAQEKLKQITDSLVTQGVATCILTLPASVAWLFNIRASDIPFLPAPLGFAIVHVGGQAELFLNPPGQPQEVMQYFGENVSLYAREEFATRLRALVKNASHILVDKKTCPIFITDFLQGADCQVIFSQDPCLLPQACKNSVEITGARNAHIRDGTALVNFLAWLSRVVPAKNITELDASKKLLSYRQLQQYFEEPSFPTISSAGPNGAIIHYCPTPETNRTLQPDELYLVDSGGQYLDGTTDVTRVMAFAAPTDEQRDRFTRVLKGHIALAQARFPQGTTGQQLDILARYWLWQAGLDFEHSTGHGVGSYLSVHEGPQNISKARAGTTHVPLQVGMLLSNEPGYYKSGEYGMRIESIVVVKELENESYEYPILGFETITLAPICRALIEPKLLSTSDINWLNRYHKKVREILMPLVEETARSWLQKETEEIT